MPIKPIVPPKPIAPAKQPSAAKSMSQKMLEDAKKFHAAADRFSREGDRRRAQRALDEKRRFGR